MSNSFNNIVNYIVTKSYFNTIDIAKSLQIDHDEVIDTVRLIQSSSDYLNLSEKYYPVWKLSNIAKTFIISRSINSLLPCTYSFEHLTNLSNIYNSLTNILNENNVDPLYLNTLKNMNFIKKSNNLYLEGAAIDSKQLKNLTIITDLTDKIVQSGDWETISLAPYNFEKIAKSIQRGKLHCVNVMKTTLRRYLFDVGFIELQSASLIDKNYWNYVGSTVENEQDVTGKETVKEHCFLPTSSEQNIKTNLNTSLSSNFKNSVIRQLYLLKGNNSVKQFTINKIINYEKYDETHSPEFHTIDIIIIDLSLQFSHTFGLVSNIFQKLKIDVDFKPSYSLFTEPSSDIICFHQDLDRWIKIGKTGNVRPIILKKLGFPKNSVALSVCLNIEKITMIKLEVVDINELLNQLT